MVSHKMIFPKKKDIGCFTQPAITFSYHPYLCLKKRALSKSFLVV